MAAISRSFLSTLVPLSALSFIQRMGPVFWRAPLLFTMLGAVHEGTLALIGLVPLASLVLRPFVDAYATLASGCILGLAVCRSSAELGLD